MKRNSIQEKYLIFKIKYSKDPDAYGKLYDLYVDRIFRFIFFKVSRLEDAEDITSEVFLKTWQYIRTTEKKIDNINALLYRTARNSVIDHYRQKRMADISLSEEEQFKQIMDARNLEKELEVKIKYQEFEKYLSYIKDEYREVIVLRYIEGFSINEIAEILKKTKNNIRVLLHRGIKRLKEIAEDDAE